LKLCAEYRERLNNTNLIDFYRSVGILYLIMKKEYFKSYMDSKEFWNFIDDLRDVTKNHAWEFEDEDDWYGTQECVKQSNDYISQLDAIRSSTHNSKTDDSEDSNE